MGSGYAYPRAAGSAWRLVAWDIPAILERLSDDHYVDTGKHVEAAVAAAAPTG
jgi:hypothetical protein